MNRFEVTQRIVALFFVAFAFLGNFSEFPSNSLYGYMYNINDIKNINNINNINNISNINNNNYKANKAKKIKQRLSRLPFVEKVSRSRKFNGAVLKYMWAIKMHESHGNYKKKTPYSSACGAYQYITSTWNNYKGYKTACDAPQVVQDARAYHELYIRWHQHKDWRVVIAAHFYPAYATDRSKWDKPISGNPTVNQYVASVLKAKRAYENYFLRSYCFVYPGF